MKTAFLALIFSLFTVSTYAQQHEPDSSIDLVMVEDTDSLIVFKFTDTNGKEYTVQSAGGFWRNGDFILMYLNNTFTEELSFLIKGRVTYETIKKSKEIQVNKE